MTLEPYMEVVARATRRFVCGVRVQRRLARTDGLLVFLCSNGVKARSDPLVRITTPTTPCSAWWTLKRQARNEACGLHEREQPVMKL